MLMMRVDSDDGRDVQVLAASIVYFGCRSDGVGYARGRLP